MTTHAYIRPGGVWNSGIPVLHGEFAALDFAQFDSLSASGGAYAPSSVITVGGSGMTLKLVGGNQLSGYLLVDPSSTIEAQAGSNVSLDGSNSFGASSFTFVNSGATWTFDTGSTLYAAGTVNVSGNTQFQAGSFTEFLATVVFGSASSAGFLGSASFYNAVNFYSGSAVNFYAGSTVTIAGAVTLTSALTLSGGGTIIDRVTTGSNADSTYSVSTTDIVYILQSSITAARTYFLDEIGATNGKKICFHREDNNSARPITLKRTVDGSTICVLNWDLTGYIWTEVLRVGGIWKLFRGSIHA